MSWAYRDPDWLEERYHAAGLTQRAIAEECDVAPVTIRRWMKRHGTETREIKGENHGLYGKERRDTVKQQISKTLEGRDFSDETRRRIGERQHGQSLPAEVREKISESLTGITRSEKTRIKMSKSTAGAQNPNWKGGEFSADWYGPEWTVIRDRIRKRDKVCQHCGHDGAVTNLDVHHIVPVRVFRESDELNLRDANRESNLILLCKRCHAKADHGVINPTSDSDGIPEERKGEDGLH